MSLNKTATTTSAKDTSTTTTTTTATVTVKTEKRSRETEGSGEYDEWAKRLVNRPIPQLQPTATNFASGQIFQSGNGTFLIQGIGGPGASTCVGGDGLPPHNGFDMDSAIGRFTWLTFAEDKYVPCIYRSGDLYCCVRMAEITLDPLLKALPPEISGAIILKSYNLTPAEAKLLTYINNWHCDGFYGSEPFTAQDLLVIVPELEKLYAYLSFSHGVLQSGGGNKTNDFSKCGFVKVNQDSVIPYTVMNENDKGIPLFYFEGQIDILNAKSQDLRGWELAYLKLCCKVQGVRKDLISGEKLRIVKLVDLKGYFPKRTTFAEKNWPAPKPKSLLPKQTNTTQQLTPTTRWNTTVSNDSFDKTGSNSSTLTTRSVTGLSFASPQYTSNGVLTTTTASNILTPQGLNGVSRNGFSVGVTPIVTTMSGVSANNSSQASIIMPNGSQIQVPKNQIVAARTSNLAKIRAPGPPADTSKLTIIPEVNDQVHRENAYAVRMIIIDKEVLHCINQKPQKYDVYLLVLPEFLTRFFPTFQISIYPTVVSVLKSIGISIYLPNSAQVRVFNSSGFSIQKVWELPLIAATDAASQLSKLKTLLTPKPTAGPRTSFTRLPLSNNRTLLTASSNRPNTRNSAAAQW